MERICYISRNYRGLTTSGNKAKTDYEDTLAEMGAVNLALRRTTYRNKVVTFLLNLMGIMKYTFCVRKDDVLVLQYPLKKYFTFVCRVAHWRKARVVALIHDLGSMRRRKLTVGQEIGRLSNADYVIASNEVMRQWLEQKGLTIPMGALGLHDYRGYEGTKVRGYDYRGYEGTGVRGYENSLVAGDTGNLAPSHPRTPAPPKGNLAPSHPRTPAPSHPRTPKNLPIIVYAGALAMRKNAFMLQMGDIANDYQLHVYGNADGLPGLQPSPSVVIKGFIPAEEFIAKVEGDYGLVWDGDSLDACTGNFGEYLRYNSPHKLSFYIRAGLPVVVWQEAALASIVEKEGIGLCIDSIRQLGERLAAITQEQHATMLRNVSRVSQKMSEGGFLRNALQEAMLHLKTSFQSPLFGHPVS